MLKYLDEDDFKKLQILYYLENHHLSTVLFDDLIEELHLNNYQNPRKHYAALKPLR